MKRSNNELETINPNITETKRDISAKYLTLLSPSPAIYPIENTTTRNDIVPTTNNIKAARESTYVPTSNANVLPSNHTLSFCM